MIELARVDQFSTGLNTGLASVSFVDCVSFAFMRERGIAQAFAFDQHFEYQGFTQPRMNKPSDSRM